MDNAGVWTEKSNVAERTIKNTRRSIVFLSAIIANAPLKSSETP